MIQHNRNHFNSAALLNYKLTTYYQLRNNTIEYITNYYLVIMMLKHQNSCNIKTNYMGKQTFEYDILICIFKYFKFTIAYVRIFLLLSIIYKLY